MAKKKIDKAEIERAIRSRKEGLAKIAERFNLSIREIEEIARPIRKERYERERRLRYERELEKLTGKARYDRVVYPEVSKRPKLLPSDALGVLILTSAVLAFIAFAIKVLTWVFAN